MSLVDLVMPKLGESIMEATILKWHKKPGDNIAMDETVLDIATDKVDSEVPSTAAGVLEEVLFKENDVVPIGSTIARIRVGGNEDISTARPVENVKPVMDVPFAPAAAAPAPAPLSDSPTPIGNANASTPRFYSPLVLNIAQQEGISMTDLERIPGTGQEGRVTKKDILAFVANRQGKPQQAEVVASNAAPAASAHVQPAQPQMQGAEVMAPAKQEAAVPQGNVEIIEMDRMRKMIAKHMVDSVHTSPHVTSFAECDVTNLVLWRDRIKKDFEKREGDKITFTPLILEAVAKCIKKYPWVNSSVDGDRIILKKDINLGMAAALPSGNLIVPVIRNADQLNLVGLTKQVNALANAARSGKLKPDDTTGGTFTVTNVGTFGSIMGTPIINQPQVAILAVGTIKKRPVVIETPQGDSIAIRHMMYASLSYDHRIIDGALGATFLNAVCKELENFDINRSL